MKIDTSKIEKPESIHEGGKRVAPGCGMAMIENFIENGGKDASHQLNLEIVAWPEPESMGQVHEELIFLSKNEKNWCERRLTCLAMAAGIVTAEQVKAANDAGQDVEFDETQLLGRPIFIELEFGLDKDGNLKKYVSIANAGLGFYHIKDPRCRDWPRNKGLYAQWAGKVGDWKSAESRTSRRDASEGATSQSAGSTGATDAAAAAINPFAKKV